MRYAGDLPLGRTHQQDFDAHNFNKYQLRLAGKYLTGSSGHRLAVADLLYALPVAFAAPIEFDRIAMRVYGAAAAGKKARMGIYLNKDDTELYPGALALDSGEVAVDSTGIKAVTIAYTLSKGGIIWLAFITNGTPDIYELGFHQELLGFDSMTIDWTGLTKSQAYGALPDPFPAGGGTGTTYNRGPTTLRVKA